MRNWKQLVNLERLEAWSLPVYFALGIALYVFYRDQMPTVVFWAVPVAAIGSALAWEATVERQLVAHVFLQVGSACFVSALGYFLAWVIRWLVFWPLARLLGSN